MKKYKITINSYSYETEAKNEEEAKLTAEDINWNRVDVEEIKKEKHKKTIKIDCYSSRDFPSIDEIIEKDGKKYRVIDNSIRNVTTAELVSD